MRTAVLCILFGNVLGGLSYFWSKRACEGLPPFTVTFGRCVIGMACLGTWLALQRGPRWPFGPADRRPLVITGVLACAIPMALGILGTDLSTSANGSILILLEPVAIVGFARILLGEHVGLMRGLGLAVGLGGAAIVTTAGVGGGFSLFSGEYFAGNLALAASGILWGLYTPVLTPVARRHAAVPVTFAVVAISTAALLVPALMELRHWEPGPHLGSSLAYTAVMGVGVTFLGTLAWNRAMRDLPAGVIAPFVFLQPAVGVLAGMLWLEETLSAGAILGGLLVAGGVALVLLGERRRSAAAAPSGTGT